MHFSFLGRLFLMVSIRLHEFFFFGSTHDSMSFFDSTHDSNCCCLSQKLFRLDSWLKRLLKKMIWIDSWLKWLSHEMTPIQLTTQAASKNIDSTQLTTQAKSVRFWIDSWNDSESCPCLLLTLLSNHFAGVCPGILYDPAHGGPGWRASEPDQGLRPSGGLQQWPAQSRVWPAGRWPVSASSSWMVSCEDGNNHVSKLKGLDVLVCCNGLSHL